MFPGRLRAPVNRAGLALAVLATVGPAAACGSAVTIPPLCTHAGPEAQPDTFAQQVSLLTLPYGMRYGDISVGCGATVKPGQQVTAEYTGWLQDGTEFDSSRNAGRQPFVFALGEGQVIRGFDVGVLNMRVGGKRRLVIPPVLGYGAQGVPSVIPANTTLIIDVEVLSAS